MNCCPLNPLVKARALFRRLIALIALTLGLFALPLSAADAVLEGRVLNLTSNTYVENARVTVASANVEVFTNKFGEYRITGLPAGEVTVTAFFTGLTPVTSQVVIKPGASQQLDFSLDRFGPEVVRLTEFTVAESREMNAAAIAINEQRFAPNLKTVVAADAFGDSTENNVAEFIKFLPGVSVDYSGPDARQISIRGMPANQTQVMVDGFQVANASSSSATRTVEVESLNLNNVARVEVTKVPTPDAPASSLGGSVNTVSKSAFERVRALFTYRLFAGARQGDLDFKRSPGPLSETAGSRVTPNVDFSYIVPVSKTLGFTVGASYTSRYTQTHFANVAWVPFGSASALAPATNPMLRTYQLLDQPTYTTRSSVGGTVDWKFAPHDVLSIGVQYFYGVRDQAIEGLQWDVAGTSTSPAPTAWGPDFTRGATGRGNATFTTDFRRKTDITSNVNLRYRHDGPIWKVAAGANYSASTNRYTAVENGYFDSTITRLNNITVNFDQIGSVRPASITTFNTDGTAVDSRDPRNFRLISATNGTARNSTDAIKGLKGSLARDIDLKVPVTVKIGAEVLVQDRDINQVSPTWSFVGPDGVANTTDDAVSRYELLDSSGYSGQAPPFGESRIQWVSPQKIYQLYQQHPEYFARSATQDIVSSANNSRKITETISAGFIRFDTRLLQNRFRVVAGVRFERTEDDGYGVKNDIRATYQQDAAGNLILDSAGRPIKASTDPVTLARLQYTQRGLHQTRSYDDYYPSVNLTYTITPSLLARFGYAHTIGRPDFSNIVPGVTVSDPANTSATPILTVNNTGLKPWASKSYDVSLEYYFKGNGVASIGVFRKDISDFFGSLTTPATAGLLAQFGLPDDYVGYDFVTKLNVGSARVTGLEANFRQPLGALGRWAKGFQLFANATDLHLEGSTIADFSTFVRRNINYGLSYNSPRFSGNLNWNYRGRQRQGMVTGTNIPAGTYAYLAPRLVVDINLEYRLTKKFAVYFTGRNLDNISTDQERYATGSPYYARRFQTGEAGAFYSLGFKGEF